MAWTDGEAEARADKVAAGRGARCLAGIAAGLGWAALALQLALIVGQLGPAQGAWRFLGYYTILANIGAATVATAVALGSARRIGGARARLMAATAIALVGLIYSLVLRSLWDSQGLQQLVDFVFHDAVPLLFVVMWALAPHGSLDRKDFAWALAPPLTYAAYALARGAADGWYAYWFLDPAGQGPNGLAQSIAVIFAAFALVAGLLIAIDRWKGRGVDPA